MLHHFRISVDLPADDLRAGDTLTFDSDDPTGRLMVHSWSAVTPRRLLELHSSGRAVPVGGTSLGADALREYDAARPALRLI